MSETGPRTRSTAAAKAGEEEKKKKDATWAAIAMLSIIIILVSGAAVMALAVAVAPDSPSEADRKIDLLIMVVHRITTIFDNGAPLNSSKISWMTSDEKYDLQRDLLALQWLAEEVVTERTRRERHLKDKDFLRAYREWEELNRKLAEEAKECERVTKMLQGPVGLTEPRGPTGDPGPFPPGKPRGDKGPLGKPRGDKGDPGAPPQGTGTCVPSPLVEEKEL